MSDARAVIADARRVVVKVGSSSLTAADGSLAQGALVALVGVVAGMRARGQEVVLVTSGAIAAGLHPLGLASRPRDLASAQATAAVGQGLLVDAYATAFAEHGIVVGQVLLTADDVERAGHYANAQRALVRMLEMHVVPIVNENDTVATEEIRFGDNDRLAALVANVVRADALVLVTDVDALYTAAPDTPGAERIDVVEGPERLQGIDISRRGSHVGTGGMVTKLEAASIATTSGIAVILCSAADAERAVAGEPVGTLFVPRGKRETTRLQWLAHAARPRGAFVLDGGAVRALAGGRASLLAAGVTEVRGAFEVGEPVELLGPDGAPIGRGFAGVSAAEAQPMLGLSTAQLASTLGDYYARELVHIDQLVVF